MKKYIDFNTEKIMNAAYGKIMKLMKNNEKFTKKNQCEISKQWKEFFEIYEQTNLRYS